MGPDSNISLPGVIVTKTYACPFHEGVGLALLLWHYFISFFVLLNVYFTLPASGHVKSQSHLQFLVCILAGLLCWQYLCDKQRFSRTVKLFFAQSDGEKFSCCISACHTVIKRTGDQQEKAGSSVLNLSRSRDIYRVTIWEYKSKKYFNRVAGYPRCVRKHFIALLANLCHSYFMDNSKIKWLVVSYWFLFLLAQFYL